MKALTLYQPHATLVALGKKKIETRSWKTDYRGPLAIHAAKAFPWEYERLCWGEPFRTALGLPPVGLVMLSKILPFGAIVATCDLVDCLGIPEQRCFCSYSGQYGQYETVLPPEGIEFDFGNYEAGRFAWILENVKALPEPIPAKGMQRLWEWEGIEDAAENI